jgi:hypothetical protein
MELCMRSLNRLFAMTSAAIISMTCLAACSKTVQWEEEVLLNTGQTIIVKRKVDYNVTGGAGNPLDLKYRPNFKEKISFTWNGKSYEYYGDAYIFVLAITASNTPVLVAPAANKSWNFEHDYKCTLPFYVQLMPDDSGKNWTWPTKIEPWLYNLPTNLLQERRPLGEMKAKYVAADIEKQEFMGDPSLLHSQKIVPTYTGDLCKSLSNQTQGK